VEHGAESRMPEDRPIIDWEVARRSIPGGEAGLRDVGGMMLEDGPRLLAELRAALDAADGPRARLAAHTLLGGARHFGAAAVIHAAATIEAHLAAENLDAAAAATPALETQLARLLEALRAAAKGG